MPFPGDNSGRPHSRFLRGGRWSEEYACYAVTKCTDRRKAVLTAPQRAEIIMASLNYLRTNDQIRLLAFCIMPDHYHALFFLLPPAKSLSVTMEQVGRYTARIINKTLHRTGRFWQDGFHDHRCRGEDDMNDRLVYIELNPVRAGLVDEPRQWEYSSAHPNRAAMLDRGWYGEMR